jgi:uncharacterized circularly permuted ATP-grasp superfamily protein/uncharacterized alpha-E superfamily protein
MPETAATPSHDPFSGYRSGIGRQGQGGAMHPAHGPGPESSMAIRAWAQPPAAVDAVPAWDELIGGDGLPRPHWRQLVDLLASWQPEELSRRWEQARRQIHDNGVTYNVHEDRTDEQRPWVLDPIPLVVAADDWARLEVGLNQRARVLDALLADLYGPQQLLREGILPPELVLAHPGFLRPCHGMTLPGGRWLHLYAAIVARDPLGRWLVLGDRTGVPHGLGYALENRLVVSRMLPSVFQECRVERLAPFFMSLRSMLRTLAPNRDQPRIALQSPGPSAATYFEDAYLARYLGYPLVEGGDLAARDGRVSLKTLGGLVPMDVLLRRVPDRECDPLELDGGALAGTPGLVNAVREGRLAMASALGASLAESPALQEFLPAVSRRLLGEDLLLESPRSWWCGRPENLARVLASLETMVIEPAAPGRGVKRIVPAALDMAARERLAERIAARPADWVGRAIAVRSLAPCWNGSAIVPGSVALRCFAVASPEGYASMRGGLARVAYGGSPPLAEDSISAGQGSKDIWVLAVGPVQQVSLLPPRGQPLRLRRSGNDLPSRVADHLFWLGRHVERAESMSRLLRTVASRVTGEGNLESAAAVARLLGSTCDPPGPRAEWLESGRAATPGEMADEIRSLAFDDARPASLAASLAAMWRMASVVRDRISIDSWRILARIHRGTLRSAGRPSGRAAEGARRRSVLLGVAQVGDLLPVFDSLILDLSAFAGLGNESMTRGPGWLFLDMGRRVERAWQAITLHRETLVTAPITPVGDDGPSGSADDATSQRLHDMLLEIADSAMTYRNRYLGAFDAGAIIDLLVIDQTNPRSLAFQLAALADHVERLPRDASSPVLSGEQRAVMAATNLVRLADVTTLAAVDAAGNRPALATLFARIDSHMRAFTESLAHTYLVHSTLRRRLGDSPEQESSR